MVIRDYLLLSEGKAGHRAAKTRLGHVIDYLAAKTPTARVSEVDERWIEEFRAWLLAKPVVDRKGEPLRPRSLSAVEGSVLQLSAAINAAPSQEAAFKAIQQKEVSASPVYRADVPMLAKMFNYCLRPDGKTEKVRAVQLAERESLLRFLRMAVATWARPDALFDLTPAQWHAAAGVLDLNPPGRRQTVKHRPKIPVAKQYAPFLTDGTAYLSISVINVPWAKLRERCGLPADRQAGPKLIRRTMATLVRKRIGEANWRQGQMMLGHVKSSVSDIYAIPDPLNLGLALSATESIIDEIERLAPGAFTAPIPQPEGDLEAKNG
jgi:integrase